MFNCISEIYDGNHPMGVRVKLDRTIIGLLARGVREHDSNGHFKDQHADCIIPIDGVIGFTQGQGPASGGSLSYPSAYCTMNVEGGVLTTEELEKMAKKGPTQAIKEQALMMIDARFAKKNNYSSAVLLIQAPNSTVNLFIEKWQELRDNPKPFHILGGNCSTRAKEIFVEAGVIPHKYFFIDTPHQLFEYLQNSLSLTPNYKIQTFFGYVGFEKKEHELGYDLIVLK
jgi:hypothetical protein